MDRKCLIVSYYFPPTGGSGVQRIVKLIKYASRKNWKFTVISAEEISGFQPQDKSLLSELPSNVNIIRTKSFLPAQSFSIFNKFGFFKKSSYWKRWIGAFIQIPDSRKSWNVTVKQAILAEISKNEYDCLMITAPPYSLSLLAGELQDELNIPVLLDMRDPWASHPYKINPTFIHRYLNKRLEHKTIASIKNGIHVCGLVVKDYGISMPLFDVKKWSIIPNGYDEDDFIVLKDAHFVNKKQFNIAYSGMIHADINSPEYLLRAISYLKKTGNHVGDRIHFHHIGKSVISLEKIANKYGLKNQVTSWGYCTHQESLEIAANMDALYQIHHPSYKGSKYIIGGKMYEYLRLKKPILAIVPQDGEVAMMINDCKCGEVVSSVNAAEVAKTLLSIINGHNEYSYINIEKYSREVEADQFIAAFEKAICGKVK